MSKCERVSGDRAGAHDPAQRAAQPSPAEPVGDNPRVARQLRLLQRAVGNVSVARMIGRGRAAGLQDGPGLAAPAGVQRDGQGDGAAQGGGDARQRALTIKDAFHGSAFSEDEKKALSQIRGQSVLMLREIRSSYSSLAGAVLEKEFKDYCDSGQYKEAMAILFPALPLEARLRTHDDTFSENEKGMLEVLRRATQPELNEAAASKSLLDFLKSRMSVEEYYQARKILTPNNMVELVEERIKGAAGTFNDDEDAVYSTLLDLTPAQRNELWAGKREIFSFLSAAELKHVAVICTGSEADALKERMKIATGGPGTDDDAVKLVVEKTRQAAQQETMLTSMLASGKSASGQPLSAEERRQAEAQLAALGGIGKNLLTAERGAGGELKEDSFLGMLHDDVSSQEFQAFTDTMRIGQFERAKQQILDAIGTFNDDEDAIYKAFDSLVGAIEVPPGTDPATLTPERRAELQREANRKLRSDLLNDPDVKRALDAHLDKDELQNVYSYVSADTYAIALKKLEEAYRGVDTDEEGLFKIVCGMSVADRKKLKEEQPRIYLEITGSSSSLTPEEQGMFNDAVATGKIPTDKALKWTFEGLGTEDEMIEQIFANLDSQERYEYRLGYFLFKGGSAKAIGVTDEKAAAAKAKFTRLYATMDDDLGTDDLQKALDQLLGTPTLEELRSEQGRLMAAGIMQGRVAEKGAIRDDDWFSSGFVDTFSDQGGATDQAQVDFASAYKLAMADGKLSDEEFAALSALDANFAKSYQDYVATVDAVTSVASTVAAVAAAIVVTAVSGGAAGPAAAALLTQYGLAGTAVIAGVTTATVKVGVAEAAGGSHFDTLSTEGLQAGGTGFIEGALAVLTAGLAEKAAGLVGLGKADLLAALVARTANSTDSALSYAGLKFTSGAFKGLIQGSITGAVGELVLTATNLETWKKAIWDVILSFGTAVLKGGGIGALSGALTGGALEALMSRLDVAQARNLLSRLAMAGVGEGRINTLSKEAVRALAAAELALAGKNAEQAEAAFAKLASELSNEELNNVRNMLYASNKLGVPAPLAGGSSTAPPVAAASNGFTAEENAIIDEATRIMTSPQMTQIRAAHARGEGLVVEVGGRQIQFEPGAPCSGLTNFEAGGFLIGREAFSSEEELRKTILHELYRLSMSKVKVEGAAQAAVAAETRAAADFADRAVPLVKAPAPPVAAPAGTAGAADTAQLSGFKVGITGDEIVAINQKHGGSVALTGHISSILAAAERYEGFWNKVAAMVREIAGRHMFNDGNKRTAEEVVRELVRRNGVSTGVDGADLRRVIHQVATGELKDVPEIARALRGF